MVSSQSGKQDWNQEISIFKVKAESARVMVELDMNFSSRPELIYRHFPRRQMQGNGKTTLPYTRTPKSMDLGVLALHKDS
jgi:hypothetical protein